MVDADAIAEGERPSPPGRRRRPPRHQCDDHRSRCRRRTVQHRADQAEPGGPVTETRAAVDAARRNGMRTIVSARSGETEDVAIAHLSTGWNAGQIKVGSFARSERM